MGCRSQCGTTLIIVLLLLLILTMLVIASATTATAELVMTGNEQFHRRAAEAASAGIEQAITRIAREGGADVSVPPTPFGASAVDTYATSTLFAGREIELPQSSVNKFAGHHYAITSIGTSSRGAVDTQLQGVLVLVPVAGIDAFDRVGSGLPGVSGP